MIWTIIIIVIVALVLFGIAEEGDMQDYSDQDLMDELNDRHS